MSLAEADVQGRLKALIDPNTGRDFVTGKAVKKVAVDGNDVTVDIQLGYPGEEPARRDPAPRRRRARRDAGRRAAST
jgi:hypothetical protein